MDFPIVIIVVAAIGLCKVYLGNESIVANRKSETVQEAVVLNESMGVQSNSIPIGNNLGLIKDNEAFTLILKELGLRKK